ncbi:MAG: hypothetical protein NTW87_30195 [Planctomycetota bacterium]|nr:hypothetical protein [Planctomycetota bacterium]
MLLLLTAVAFAGDARLAEPPKEAQQEAEKTIKELFAEDYKKTTPDDQSALAFKLLAKSGGTKDDPKAQYVLLREARDMAAKAGDVATAMAAIDQMAGIFEVDALDLQAKALASLRSNARTPDANKAVAEAALAAADHAVAKDIYDVATRLAEIATSTARVSGEPALAAQAQSRGQDVAKCQSAYVNVKVAVFNLSKNPNDADAKFKIGQFYCLVKDDRVAGLVYLSEGSNQTWGNLAKMELANPTEVAEMMKVADGYHGLIASETGAARDKLKQWAAQWYQKALPTATGITKAKIEQRLKELTPAVAASTPAVPGTAAPAAALPPNLMQLISDRTRKALPTDAEMKRFEGREQAEKSGDTRKSREYSALYHNIRSRLVLDAPTWNEADVLARLEAQTKINKATGEPAGYLGDTWLEDPLPLFMSTCKNMDQFAARVMALEKATGALGTPTKAQVADLVKPAMNAFISRNRSLFPTPDSKVQFCDWLKKQGVTSTAVDDYKSTLK